MVAALMDITERYKTEQELHRALAEKDFLMKELSHRVKNNLATIRSLIELKNAALGEHVDLSDVTHQVDAIRIIHEKLYRTGSVSEVDAYDYFSELLDSLFASSQVQPIRVNRDIERLRLDSKTAMTLGLIINEIATNAIKHGFHSEGEHRFSVEFGKDEQRDRYVLTLSNTGAPFPEDVSLENPTGLGLQLIGALVTQLEGTIEITRRPRPVFTITFHPES
jgi:two-component sensor histidine kinase